MTTLIGTDASVYWNAVRVPETRTATIDLGTDFADDTVHGDQNRTFAPTFANFGVSVSGLWNTGVAGSGLIVADALAKTSRSFSVYLGNSQNYFLGNAYVSVDEVGAPFDDFDTFNWSLKPVAAVSQYYGAEGV